MKVRRLDKSKEPLGYCHDCHNRAVIEIMVRAGRPPLHLCARDARYMIKHVTAALNGNGKKNGNNHTAK
jgi:hypothetical protein